MQSQPAVHTTPTNTGRKPNRVQVLALGDEQNLVENSSDQYSDSD